MGIPPFPTVFGKSVSVIRFTTQLTVFWAVVYIGHTSSLHVTSSAACHSMSNVTRRHVTVGTVTKPGGSPVYKYAQRSPPTANIFTAVVVCTWLYRKKMLLYYVRG
jgi:hypothetical protein